SVSNARRMRSAQARYFGRPRRGFGSGSGSTSTVAVGNMVRGRGSCPPPLPARRPRGATGRSAPGPRDSSSARSPCGSLDGFSETHVVGDEEVGSRQLQRLLERRELVVHQLDASAERALKELGIGGGDRVPFERVQVGREVARRIELRNRAEP